MSETLETVKTINSSVRTGLMVMVVGGVGAGSFYGYNLYNQAEQGKQAITHLKVAQEELRQKEKTVREQSEELDRRAVTIRKKDEAISKLAAAMRALKVTQRVAVIDVLDQRVDELTKKAQTVVQFREVTEDGKEVDKPREFTLDGTEVHVDCLLVKFEDHFVEESDVDKGATLYLFNRIYGDLQAPADGHALDVEGDRPQAYASGGKLSDFERDIWKNFWKLAGNPEEAAKYGIRAAHGQANYTKVEKGKRYRLERRASDGMTLTPEEGEAGGSGDSGVFRKPGT